MGDVSTNLTINHFVASQVKTLVPAAFIPDDHYTYLEFGNYLTDVSQFRDPAAHHGGRKKAHLAALWTATTLTGPDPVAAIGIFLTPITIPVVYCAGLVGWTH